MRVRPSANISQAHKYSRVAFVFIAWHPRMLQCRLAYDKHYLTSRNWHRCITVYDRFRNVMLSCRRLLCVPDDDVQKSHVTPFHKLLGMWIGTTQHESSSVYSVESAGNTHLYSNRRIPVDEILEAVRTSLIHLVCIEVAARRWTLSNGGHNSNNCSP